MSAFVANAAVARSAVLVRALPFDATARKTAPARIALLGTGNVGSAVLARLQDWQGTPLDECLSLVHVANTREAFCARAAGPMDLQLTGAMEANTTGGIGLRALRGNPALRTLTKTSVPRGEGLDIAASALGCDGRRILIDATASEAVAARHADWLAQGIDVVTACKLGQGTSLSRWRAIQAACIKGGTQYGDSATVGAGLPLLRTIRGLRAGGDRIHAIAGVLSGSLAWLFHHFDGRLSFSGFVEQAREAGYTEPDPREDLSGEDVRRKLLILARAAGVELEADAVAVESLVPDALAAFANADLDAGLPLLDVPLRERFADARKRGERLHFVARLQKGQARVGLESLAADDPLAAGTGTDNRVAIWSDRYSTQPLVVQGPGAGAGITAAAMLDDALAFQAVPKYVSIG